MKTGMAPGVTPCPRCKQIGLELDTKFKAKDPTTVSLAGGQVKLTGKFLPHLSCKSGCGWEAWGYTETGHVIFAFDKGDPE